jgi:parvulin-like peptidyl-prolyl isomerase
VRFKKLLAVCLTAPLLTLAACGGSDEGDDAGSSDAASQEQSPDAGAAPEPDLEGIPDVVAEVDGVEIGKDEFVAAYEGSFQQQASQAQMSGQPIDQDALKKQTAQGLVSRYLLTAEAADRGIEASESEVDKTLEELAEQNKMSQKKFLAALEEQGMSEDEVRSQVESQVEVDGLVADEAGTIKASEAEMRQAYDAAKAQQQSAGGGQQLPPYKKVKDQLAEQVKSQKETAVTQKLEKQLRKKADITIHL